MSMKRSINITTHNNSLLLSKNKAYKYVQLLLSFIAETLMLYLLVSGFYSALDKNKSLIVLLLIVIFIVYIIFVFLSLRKFMKDVDYILTRNSKQIVVNGGQQFDAGLSGIAVKQNVNRWGTETFNISICKIILVLNL